MLRLNSKLEELEEAGQSIKVALAGAGQMGKGLVSQISQVKGMEIVAVADLYPERGVQAFQEAGLSDEEIIVTDSLDEADEAIFDDKVVVTRELRVLTRLVEADVVVEATGSPNAGALVGFLAINNGKHVVMLNVEADVTVGPLLSHLAENAGLVYTLSAGDEPGALIELYNFADALGFRIVAAGKGKNNPLDRYATPDDLIQLAAEKGASPKMLTAFVDGTKTMVEMNAVSNATGLVPDVPGMHGPVTSVEELCRTFSLKSQGGILKREGVVDFAIGDVAPGVFVIITTDQETIKKDMDYLKMGSGPNYLLYRPYHLCNIETPLSVALAALYGEPWMIPLGKPVSETIPVAKRDLKAGEILDGIGGFTTYSTLVIAEVARDKGYLPLGLVEGARLKRDVSRDELITYDMVELDESSFVLPLRRLQDRMFE